MRSNVHIKRKRHTRQRKRVTQWNQITGLLGSLNTSNTRNAKYIAFFSCTAFNQFPSCRLHMNRTRGNSHAMGMGFVSDIDHMGLALGVKVGESAHGVRKNR
jgi:hypothetical protein